MKIKLSFIVLISISACHNNYDSKNNIESIDIIVQDSTILKEDEHVLYMAGYSSHQDNGFVIHNPGEQSLILYDSAGVYESKIKKIGRGENEYLNVNSFVYDNNKIIIYDATLDKAITYDTDGRKVNETIGILDRKFYFRSRNIYKINNSYYLAVIDSKNYPNNLEKSILLKEIYGNNTIGSYPDEIANLKNKDFSPHITSSNDNIYVAYGMLGKMYKIDINKDKTVKEVRFSANYKTPSYQLSEEEILINKKRALKFEKNRSKITNIIYSNGRIFLYYVNRNTSNNNSIYNMEVYNSDLELLYFSQIDYIPNFINSKNYFRSIFYNNETKNFLFRKGFIKFNF